MIWICAVCSVGPGRMLRGVRATLAARKLTHGKIFYNFPYYGRLAHYFESRALGCIFAPLAASAGWTSGRMCLYITCSRAKRGAGERRRIFWKVCPQLSCPMLKRMQRCESGREGAKKLVFWRTLFLERSGILSSSCGISKSLSGLSGFGGIQV